MTLLETTMNPDVKTLLSTVLGAVITFVLAFFKRKTDISNLKEMHNDEINNIHAMYQDQIAGNEKKNSVLN